MRTSRVAVPREAGARRASPVGRRVLQLVAAALILAGIAVLAGIGWQVWVQSPEAASAQSAAAAAQTDRWLRPGAAAAPRSADRVPIRQEPRAVAATVAVLRVPRFGHSWQRVVRQGVDEDAVLDSFTAGVGHYPGTAMPGGVGNFAVAGHDTGWGDAFRDLGQLRIGDPLIVQTADGWYTYAFRNFQWVPPSTVAVLAAVPMSSDVARTRVITLTTCDPPYNAQERMIAYGAFTSFTPTSDGPPPGW